MKLRQVFLLGSILLVIFLVFGFYNQFQSKAEKATSQKLHVLTTFTVLADMAKNVAGDYATVESLTKPGTEIHGYEPTPQDIVRLSKADIIFDNGMYLEKWAEKLYQNVPDVPHKTLSEGIIPTFITQGPYTNKPNPHAWMSPANALIYVDNIQKAFLEIDPQHKQQYKVNAQKYKDQIRQVDQKLRQELQVVSVNKRYLVSCEGAFSYLIKDYQMKELYLWPINADAQGTPQQIQHVIEVVKDKKIPTLFCESTVNDKAQRQVASETGSHYGGVFYVDSLSDANGPTPTYLKMLEYNATLLIEGLQRGEAN